MLLRELKLRGLRAEIGIVDASFGEGIRRVHWSYWSKSRSYYDTFSLGQWQRATSDGRPAQPLDPYTLRVVRSDTVLQAIQTEIDGYAETINAKVRKVSRQSGTYTLHTDAGTYITTTLFDSIPTLPPVFPAAGPRGWVSGTGLIVESDHAVFKSQVATLFEPLPDGGLAYVLPFDRRRALVESAYFATNIRPDNASELLHYLKTTYGSHQYVVRHHEHGAIPLGFAPGSSLGAGHILLGAKRGLIKPSAGYGVRAIEHESKQIAEYLILDKEVPASRRYSHPWQFMDRTFLRLLTDNPAAARQLMSHTMQKLTLSESLRLLDEDLPPARLASFMVSCLPMVARYTVL